MSATAALVALTVCTIPRLSAPMCSFIPKCQFLPLRVCFISGSRVALAFLVELGAAMMVASTMVPERSNNRRSSSRPVIESKIAWVSPWRSSKWRKRRIVLNIRHPLVAQLHPRETPHRFAIVDRIFRLRVRQIEPLLQEVKPQHLLHSQRLSSVARLRIVRCDQPKQPRPRNHRIHLGQKPFVPRHLAFGLPCHRSERPLMTHPLTSASAVPPIPLYLNRSTCAEVP